VRHGAHRWIVYALLGAMVVYNLVPFFWMLASSFKSILEVLRFPATLIPEAPTLEAYRRIWLQEGFLQYFTNSLITAGSTALFSSVVGVFAGYGFSRFRFRGRVAMMGAMLASQMLPGVLLVGPYFEILSVIELYDTRFGLIVALTTITLPFSVWMLKGYIDTIPQEIDQAALMDGASRFQVLFLLIVPNILPGFVATMTFAFLLAWGDVLWALALISERALQPMTLGILQLIGQFRMEWSMIMAATVIASAIPAVLYVLLQRYLVQGFAGSAVRE
jgi:multiple sugar transport system permease protein